VGENYLYTPGSETTLYLKYNREKKTLEIGFRTKEVYRYLNVPLQLWKNYFGEVSAGGSSGKFFNAFIKDKYKFEKLT
jgi:hypothetical protein